LSLIPECWPPSPPAPDCRRVVPMFPLANVWLVPNAVMPLHIFEPRYRKLVQDVLDDRGELVLATVVQGREGEMAAAPPVYGIAGLGEITQFERLPEGRFLIMLAGRQRVLLEETESDAPYRRVRVTPAEERPAPEVTVERLRERLTEAILSRRKELLNLPETLPLGCLADLLALSINPPHTRWHRIYCELDVGRRAELALAEHERH
jgi:Lon protease-like protein